MKIWLVFIDSYDEFQAINSYLKDRDRKSIHNIIYYIIEGPIKGKEGRVFGLVGERLLAVSFYTYDDLPIREIVESKISKNSSNIIIIDDLEPSELSSEEDFEAECYIKRGKSYFSENELYEYMKNNGVKISKFDLIR